ncbi:glycosyltransferase family 4 protein [Gordonia defluvii]|uniref:Glycosyltransferase family 4 protein n=1 Tax=Gordonia defluvii TaxID=283718 RepID=A0ABP6L994_9ACTN
MKLLLVSWEYPPVVVGGLGRHVHSLAVELASIGHDVVVLTRRPTGSDATSHPTTFTTTEGVRVIAAAEDPPEFDFGTDMMPWTLAMGHTMIRAGLRLLRDDGTGQAWLPDVVHAHDWLVAHPAIALAEFFDVPLVATIHATEAGRHSGWVAAKTNRQVHSVEWWLAREADALITCSTSMRDEVSRLFGPDLAEIQVIHNGIAVDAWPHRRLTGSGPGSLVAPTNSGPAELLFAGRLEYEKGVQDLLAALPRIRRTHPGTTLTIAGSGTQQEWLEELTRKHRIVGAVDFLGSVERSELIELMHRCAAIVLPSRYEPFGIVALEAAATGIPLVVSAAGGLGEAVTDSVTGMTFPPADVTALAAAVRATLDDPAAAAARAQRAYARLTEEFSWRTVAERTSGTYLAAKRRVRHPIGRPNIVVRPLPERDPSQPL